MSTTASLFGLTFGVALLTLLTLPTHANACTTLTSAPTGYASPSNVYSPSDLLVDATCTDDGFTPEVGHTLPTDGTAATYARGYVHDGTQWQPYDLTPTDGASRDGDWIMGPATGSQLDYETAPTYFVAFTCQWRDNAWRCGCQDTTCATPRWQVQGVVDPTLTVGDIMGGDGGTDVDRSWDAPPDIEERLEVRDTVLEDTRDLMDNGLNQNGRPAGKHFLARAQSGTLSDNQARSAYNFLANDAIDRYNGGQADWKDLNGHGPLYAILRTYKPNVETAAQRAAIRNFFNDEDVRASERIAGTINQRGGGTPNQRLNWAAFGHLAADLIGESGDAASHSRYFQEFAGAMSDRGFFESGSLTYETEYLRPPLLVLAYSRDQQMRAAARYMVDFVTLIGAPKYIDGYYSTANMRAKDVGDSQRACGERTGNMIAYSFSMFGGREEPNSLGNCYPLQYKAEAEYEPLPLALALAHSDNVIVGQDRLGPWTFSTDQSDRGVDRTFYKNTTHSLSSLWYDSTVSPRQASFDHKHSWRIGIHEGNLKDHIYLFHNQQGNQRLSHQEQLYSSEFEWGVQDRNAYISLFDIPGNNPEGYLRGRFPFSRFDEYEVDGKWLFAREGGTLVALWANGGFDLNRNGIEGIDRDYDEIRSPGRENAIIAAVYPTELFAGSPQQAFDALRSELPAATTINHNPGAGTLSVTLPVVDLDDTSSLEQSTLFVDYRDDRRINGAPVRTGDGPNFFAEEYGPQGETGNSYTIGNGRLEYTFQGERFQEGY